MFCYLVLWLPHTESSFTAYSILWQVAWAVLQRVWSSASSFKFQYLLFSLRSSSSSSLLIFRHLCLSVFPSITWPKHYIFKIFIMYDFTMTLCWSYGKVPSYVLAEYRVQPFLFPNEVFESMRCAGSVSPFERSHGLQTTGKVSPTSDVNFLM